MKLTPKPWSWDTTPPGHDWLAACPKGVPTVWLARLPDDPAIQSRLASLLSGEERTRLERLRQREDQQRFLVGRGLLRTLVGAHLCMPPEHVKLNHGPFGKPFVISPDKAPPLHFNVSHSGQLVLLAFHPAHEVGVDVEQVRSSHDHEAIARRTFPACEYHDWTALPPEKRLTGFFRAWTRHEAGLKALGRGIAGESNTAPDVRLIFFDLALPQDYQGAACFLRENVLSS